MSLTPKQKLILDYLEKFQAEKGYSPSQKEIALEFGFSSLGTVQNYLVRLEREGYIQKKWNARRGAELSHKNVHPLRDTSSRFPASRVGIEAVDESISLPFLGLVAAGRPIEAIENSEPFAVPASMVGRGEHFVLRAQGDSMIDQGILSGDYLVVKKQAVALKGQTVIARIGMDATVKRYHPFRDRVELLAANPAFPVLVVGPDRLEQFSIEGVVTAVIRKF